MAVCIIFKYGKQFRFGPSFNNGKNVVQFKINPSILITVVCVQIHKDLLTLLNLVDLSRLKPLHTFKKFCLKFRTHSRGHGIFMKQLFGPIFLLKGCVLSIKQNLRQVCAKSKHEEK